MQKKIDKKRIETLVVWICVLIETIMIFLLHRKIIFYMDDGWYSTNLVTGEVLKGIADVVESQIWHFFNWGGRSVTHTVLQLVLMNGELFADILNMVMTFVLAYLICEMSGKKDWLYYALAYGMLISLNANVRLSMFWQSGAANYLYSTGWILLFLLVYLRQVKDPDRKAIPGVTFWIVPLGLISGWSTENMGPASFILTVMAIVYVKKWLQKKIPVWMWLGAAGALAGSVLVVCAPGNFVRSALIEEMGILQLLYQRLLNLLAVSTDYLFPVLVFLLVFLFLYHKCGNRLQPFQVLLLIMATLALGAVILSPTFPNRATFGIMVLCVILILSFLGGIEEKHPENRKYIAIFYLCVWSYAIFSLYVDIQAPLI